MQQVHFCSGSVFVTGDRIAMSLLRYVQAVAATRRSDVLAVPSLTRAGKAGIVTLMVNWASQISAESYEHVSSEFEDDEFVTRLDGLSLTLRTLTIWLGEDAPTA